MNSFKIIIAAGVIIIASNALSGCSQENSNGITMSELGMARIEAATEFQKTATIELKEVSKKENEVQFQLIMNNPENKPITSVESWLSYNPKLLKGINFRAHEDNFELMAPYMNGFDSEKGLVMFGRSAATPVSQEYIILADLTFETLSDQVITLDAFDYQYDLSGHNSVNMMREKEPLNIMLKPASPLYSVN